MHGAGPIFADLEQGREQQKRDAGDDQQHGQHRPLRRAQGIAALQGKAPLQEQGPYEDAQGEPQQGHQRVQVAAAQTEHHTKGAAQEHQGPDHDEGAQQESGRGRRAALGAELPLHQGHDHGAQYEADDLRPHILDHRGGMKPQRTGDIPLETGDTEAHVRWVPQRAQGQGGDTHRHAGQYDHPIDFFHNYLPRPNLFGSFPSIIGILSAKIEWEIQMERFKNRLFR